MGEVANCQATAIFPHPDILLAVLHASPLTMSKDAIHGEVRPLPLAPMTLACWMLAAATTGYCIVETGPELPDQCVVTRRVHPIAEQDHGQVPLRVAPEGSAGEAEVTETAAREKLPGTGLGRRRGVKTQPPGAARLGVGP